MQGVLIMDFFMHDVGFGDCFVLSDTDDVMMVDCGTISLDDNDFYKAVEDIKKDYIDGVETKQALITHLHLDHYKGFEYLSKKYTNPFNKVYIPYLAINDENTKEIVLLELAIYCYVMFGRNSHCYKLSEKILKQLDVVTKLTDYSNIYCLSTGNQFNIGNKKYDVIWPDREFEFEEKLSDYLKELNEIFSENSEFIEVKNKIIEIMKKWYTYTSLDYENTDSKAQRIEELIQSQRDAIAKLDDLKRRDDSLKRIDDITNNFRYFGTKIFARDANSTSIVFHNYVHDKSAEHAEVAVTLETKIENKNILMTGDVSKRITERYLKDRLEKRYYILKSPHHGTESCFSKHLLRADKIFISTGCTKRNYGKISPEYEAKVLGDGDRVCSSGHNFCEIRACRRMCVNSSTCTNRMAPDSL
jgi:beta-lactamase superfamily II metal-dependent hydrolase